MSKEIGVKAMIGVKVQRVEKIRGIRLIKEKGGMMIKGKQLNINLLRMLPYNTYYLTPINHHHKPTPPSPSQTNPNTNISPIPINPTHNNPSQPPPPPSPPPSQPSSEPNSN